MTDEEVMKAFQNFGKRLDELEKEREAQNQKYENMTEGELVESLADDYETAYKDAVSGGVQVVKIPNNDNCKGEKK